MTQADALSVKQASLGALATTRRPTRGHYTHGQKVGCTFKGDTKQDEAG